MLRIGSCLNPQLASELISLLVENIEVFAWSHADMVGIKPDIICHALNIDSEAKPVRQKRRAMDPKRYAALKSEVENLIRNGSIQEALYPTWVVNPVLVKKPNGK